MKDLDPTLLEALLKVTSFERDYYLTAPEKIKLLTIPGSERDKREMRANIILLAAKHKLVNRDGARLIASELLEIPIESIQEKEMNDQVSRLFTLTTPGKRGKKFWKVTSESKYVGDSIVHACIRKWGTIGCISQRKKNVYDSADRMQKAISVWTSEILKKGFEEKTDEIREISESLPYFKSRDLKLDSPTPEVIDIKIPFPSNWKEIRPLLHPAERSIYEKFNDVKTRHRRVHLSQKYEDLLMSKETDEECLEIQMIAWKLLRAAQLKYLLSLQLYPPGRQAGGILALEELCKGLQKKHPKYKRHINLSLLSMTEERLSLKKSEKYISDFISLSLEDKRLSEQIGEGGINLSRINFLMNLDENDDQDLVEDYG